VVELEFYLPCFKSRRFTPPTGSFTFRGFPPDLDLSTWVTPERWPSQCCSVCTLMDRDVGRHSLESKRGVSRPTLPPPPPPPPPRHVSPWHWVVCRATGFSWAVGSARNRGSFPRAAIRVALKIPKVPFLRFEIAYTPVAPLGPWRESLRAALRLAAAALGYTARETLGRTEITNFIISPVQRNRIGILSVSRLSLRLQVR